MVETETTSRRHLDKSARTAHRSSPEGCSKESQSTRATRSHQAHKIRKGTRRLDWTIELLKYGIVSDSKNVHAFSPDALSGGDWRCMVHRQWVWLCFCPCFIGPHLQLYCKAGVTLLSSLSVTVLTTCSPCHQQLQNAPAHSTRDRNLVDFRTWHE
jgi:hypothetical protein